MSRLSGADGVHRVFPGGGVQVGPGVVGHDALAIAKSAADPGGRYSRPDVFGRYDVPSRAS